MKQTGKVQWHIKKQAPELQRLAEGVRITRTVRITGTVYLIQAANFGLAPSAKGLCLDGLDQVVRIEQSQRGVQVL